MQKLLTAALAGLAGAAAAAAVQGLRMAQLETDPVFGMLTRPALERRMARLRGVVDVLFLDLDHVHQLNAALGYAEVDRRVRAAFQLRRGDALLLGRWYSGDEIVAVVRAGDGAGLADRLRGRLAEQGLSATIAVVGAGVRPAIETAAERVRGLKLARS